MVTTTFLDTRDFSSLGRLVQVVGVAQVFVLVGGGDFLKIDVIRAGWIIYKICLY
jgi:hypothetical protein